MATVYIDPEWTGTKSGTFEEPYDSWASVTWTAGNAYLQKEGTTFVGSITVGASGTSEAARVTLGTYDAATGAQITDPARRAKINADGAQLGISTNFAVRNFVTIDCLEVFNCRHAATPLGIYWPTGNGTDLRILRCKVHDILATGTPNGSSAGIKAFSDRSKCLYNEVSNCSDDGILVEGDGVEIAYNVIDTISVGSAFGDGIQIASATISSNDPWVHHNEIDHTSHDAKQSIVVNYGAAGGTGGIIEDNTCVAAVGASNTGGIYIGHAGIVVRRNRIFGGIKGIQTGDGVVGAKIYSNLVVMLQPQASARGIELGPLADQECYNNTVISDNPGTEAYGIEQQNATGVVIKNNVCVGWKFGLKVYAGSGYAESKNVLFNCQLAVANEAGAAVTPDATDSTADPELDADYRPRIASTVIDAGTHIRYMLDLDVRQRNNPPTIGAYEAPVTRTAAGAREPRV